MRTDDNEIAEKSKDNNTAEDQQQERLLSQEQWSSLATDAFELRPESQDSDYLSARQLPIVESVDRSLNRANMSPLVSFGSALAEAVLEEALHPELGKDLRHWGPEMP